MALSDLDVRAQYSGNGSNQTFAIPAAEIDGFETETKVYLDDTLQTLTTDYTISGTNVQFVVAPPSGTNNVTIIRQLSLTQPTDLLPSGAVDLEAIESAMDRLAALIQQVEEKTDRAPLLKITSANSSLTLPEPASDQVITWNNAGTDLENKTAAQVLALTGALIAANNLSDLASATAALTNLGIVVTTGDRALVSNAGGTGIAISTVTKTELEYLSGVTSAVQTQLDGKEPTVSLTANRALQSSAGGALEASSVTSTELGYVSGVTSAIQTQMDTKAPTANPDFTGEVDLTDQAQLNFFEGSGGGSNRLSLKAPATLSGDVDWILPSSDGGVDQFLKTDGSGNLSFDNPPSGFSNPMTTGGDIIYGSTGGAAARLANGSANQVLTSAGGTSAPTWSDTAVPILGTTSETTTYTATTSDNVILADTSGGDWTLTLYAASGNAGRVLEIILTTSDTNTLTIDGNASETIGGSTTISLYEQFERVKLLCDGSNWFVVEHGYPGGANSFTPTWGALGSGAMASTDGYWVRQGRIMHVWIYGTKDGTSGTGGGNVYATLPANYSLDSGSLPSTSVVTVGSARTGNSSSESNAIVIPGASTGRIYFNETGGGFGSGETWTLYAAIPISEWGAF